MSNFYIDYKISAIPIEEVTFTDTNQKSRTVHSTINKILSAGIERGFANSPGNIKLASDYTITNTPVTLETILGANYEIGFLLIVVNSKTQNNNPEIQVSLDGTLYPITLLGVGDGCIIPIRDSQEGNYIYAGTIKIKAASDSGAKIDVLVGV